MGSLLCSNLKEELKEILDTELDVRLPTGECQLMIGEPVASGRDLQRYNRLLLEKRRELSSAQGDARAQVPAAGGWDGDLVDQANADAEAELQIRLQRTDGHLASAIEGIRQGAYGVCEVCKRPISKARLRAVPWTRLCRECKEQQSA